MPVKSKQKIGKSKTKNSKGKDKHKTKKNKPLSKLFNFNKTKK